MTTSNISRFSSLATDPLRNFKFIAEFSPSHTAVFDSAITPTVAAGFTSITGLGINTQSIPYREGGYNTTVHQIPGMTTFQPITFTRGVMYGSDQALTWMRGLFAAAAGTGLNSAAGNFRVNITLTVNDHPNTDPAHDKPKMQFKIYNAWITGLNYSDLDATNGAILFETMTVTHEGLAVGFVTESAGVTKPVSGGGGRGAFAE